MPFVAYYTYGTDAVAADCRCYASLREAALADLRCLLTHWAEATVCTKSYWGEVTHDHDNELPGC